MLITISGLHGTGKSTIGKSLAEKLDLDYYSTGDAFRSLASEKNMSLEEFSKYVEKNPKVDKELDQKILEIASKKKDVVIDSLLSGYLLRDNADCTILLEAPLETRIRRMMDRDEENYQEKLKETKQREESEISRFKELYGIDITNEDLKEETFDIIVNTKNLSIEEVVNTIIGKLQKRN
jgi:cytidylate kinase